MRESERKRLVEQISECCAKNLNMVQLLEFEKLLIADHILDNGVVVPPCKVGDTVYVVSRYYVGDWEVYKCKIDSITIYEKNAFISCVANDVRLGRINFGLNTGQIGETVFLSREQAEAKLQEGKQ